MSERGEWWETEPTNDEKRAIAYAADQKIRDDIWRQRSETCRCTKPLVLRAYMGQRPCGRCSAWIPDQPAKKKR